MTRPKSIHRTVIIGRQRTSVALEKPFWSVLESVAQTQRLDLNELIESISKNWPDGATNLCSALRVFVLAEAMKRE